MESSTSSSPQLETVRPSGWLRVGVIATASALVGGLAAAWWYRKTLINLREAEESANNSKFGILGEERESDSDHEPDRIVLR
jgi:hypothetical protein